MPRQRSDYNAIIAFLKGSDCLVNKQHKWGTFYYDCANWSDFADGEQVFVIFGIRCVRKESLDNGVYEYYDGAGTLIHTNAA